MAAPKPPILARLLTAALVGILCAQAAQLACKALGARPLLRTPAGEYTPP